MKQKVCFIPPNSCFYPVASDCTREHYWQWMNKNKNGGFQLKYSPEIKF